MMSLPQIRTPWLKCISSSPNARLRLFCFHYGGGNAFAFRPWGNQLSDDVDVYAIELPGHGTRLVEPAITEMFALVKNLKAALLPYLTQPFAFFGHSMGALISYELSQSLQQEHRLTPAHLFVSGHRAPHVPDSDPPIHELSQAGFMNALRRYDGTPETVLNNAELMELMLPILRADFTLIENYRYQTHPPLTCPISAYGGLEDWRTSETTLKPWCEHTQAAFSLKWFEGGHFFIHSAQSSLFLTMNTVLDTLV